MFNALRRIRSSAVANAAVAARRNASTSTDYTMKVMASANIGHFQDGLHYAAKMKAAQMKPNISVYNALMNLAARDSCWLYSWAIFDDMLRLQVQPTATTFVHLIQAQRKRPHTNLWAAIQKMNELGIKPNPSIYTAIIECLIDESNVEMALHYIFLMKSQDIMPEMTAVQNVVILAAECGYSRLAIELATYFEKASRRRFQESLWTSCLVSSATNHYVDGVLQCWSIVTEELDVLPSEGVCLSVLNTAARVGHPDLATDVLRVLKLSNIEWQEYHFAALIEAFCRNNQIKEALVTLQIIRENDIEPIPATSSPIFDHISRDVDSLDAGWALIDEIHTSGTGLGIDALKIVIRASISLGDLQRAVGIYKALSDYGVKPDIAIFNLLLDGCITAQHRQLGDILLEDMKQAQIEPNLMTYEKMIRLCLTQETYEDAFYYLEEMKAANFVPPETVYDALMQKCSSAEDSRGDMVLQEMREYGYGAEPANESDSRDGSPRGGPNRRGGRR